MPHANAPLTPEGRKRLCLRVDDGRPISHVAAEAGISRHCLAKWYARWREDGEAGLVDQSSAPQARPNRTRPEIEALIEQVRRERKYGPARIAAVLDHELGVRVSVATVHRVLVRRNLNRLSVLDPPTGEQMRSVLRYEDPAVGFLHVDIKKLGRIPTGGGWRAHGRGSPSALASKRRGAGTGRVGYTYLHTAIDDHSRLAYTEALEDEKGVTAAGFWLRAVAFFAEHGVDRVRKVLTDNGSCYRSRTWARAVQATGTRHVRTRAYTPRTNGKVERFNLTMAKEWAYVREYSSEAERRAELVSFLNFYNHERPHTALGGLAPASRVPRSAYRLTAAGIAMPDPPPWPTQLTFDDLEVVSVVA